MTAIVNTSSLFASLTCSPALRERHILNEYRRFLTDVSSHNPESFHYLFHSPCFLHLITYFEKAREMSLWCSLLDERQWDTSWGSSGVILGLDRRSRILYAGETPRGGWTFTINGEKVAYALRNRSDQATMKTVENQIAEAGRRAGILMPQDSMKTRAEIVVKSPVVSGVYVNQSTETPDCKFEMKAREPLILAMMFNLPVFCFYRKETGWTEALWDVAKDLCNGQVVLRGGGRPDVRFDASHLESLTITDSPAL